MEEKFKNSYPDCMIVLSRKIGCEFKAPSWVTEGGVLYALSPSQDLHRISGRDLKVIHFPYRTHNFQCENDIVLFFNSTYPYRTIYKVFFDNTIFEPKIQYSTEFTHLIILDRIGYYCTEPYPDWSVGFLQILNNCRDAKVEVIYDGWEKIRNGTKLPEKEPTGCEEALFRLAVVYHATEAIDERKILVERMTQYLKSFFRIMPPEFVKSFTTFYQNI